jgi:hypothetical protein
MAAQQHTSLTIAGHLGHRNTSHHGPESLHGHAQLPKHERDCRASSEATVSHIKRSLTGAEPSASGEATGCEDFLHAHSSYSPVLPLGGGRHLLVTEYVEPTSAKIP